MISYAYKLDNIKRDDLFYYSDFKLQELIDIRPMQNSNYIRSSTERFNDEMELDQKKN